MSLWSFFGLPFVNDRKPRVASYVSEECQRPRGSPKCPLRARQGSPWHTTGPHVLLSGARQGAVGSPIAARGDQASPQPVALRRTHRSSNGGQRQELDADDHRQDVKLAADCRASTTLDELAGRLAPRVAARSIARSAGPLAGAGATPAGGDVAQAVAVANVR